MERCTRAALQAFATLPRFTDAESKNAEALTTPVDDLTRKILADAEYSLRMMHYGAAEPRCDWGISYQEGVFTRLPHAEASRVMSSLVCLRARTRFESGQSSEAIDDIVAGMILSRRCSLTGTNVMLLCGYAVEHRMIEALALLIPKLDPKMIPDLKKRLANLPEGSTPAVAVMAEENATWIGLSGSSRKPRTKKACWRRSHSLRSARSSSRGLRARKLVLSSMSAVVASRESCNVRRRR